jgi:teichuronic acid biosynthesis glycosyltransferase TuaC
MIEADNNNIIAVTGNFPSPRFPEKGIFIRNILQELARQDNNVDVIAPVSWVSELKTRSKSMQEVVTSPLKVERPTFTTLPLRYFKGLKKAATAFNEANLTRAVKTAFHTDKQYKYCYAHFLPAGRAALNVMRKQKIPVILNFGESSPWIYHDLYNKDRWVNELDLFGGIITVSQHNHNYLLEQNSTLGNKIRYIPNGVDTSRFKPLNREFCRNKLNLPLNEKIVLFSGHFIKRKGPLKVLEALREFNGQVKGIFLGVGPEMPKGSNVLFAGSVVNDQIQYWLNAADVFVLPSLFEGMSNSILEALACGLPSVVSNRDFNHEFIPEDSAVFVDPEDALDIGKGIKQCIDPAVAKKMSQAAIECAQRYSLEKRIRRINEFVHDLGF